MPGTARPALADAVHLRGTGIGELSFRQVGGSKRDSESGKKVGLKKEVVGGGGVPEGKRGAPGLRGKRNQDPRSGRGLTPLSEPHPLSEQTHPQ